MHLKAFCCNLAWFASQTRAHAQFRRALQEPSRVQEAVLLEILRANARSAFGREHGFTTIHSVREFQERLPLTSYEDFEPWIARIRAGETGVLTEEPVRRLMLTSGSSTAMKLIPYTAALQRDFAAAIAPWIWDLFRSDPGLMGGPAFWSITPQIPADDLVSAVPVGFEEDTEYLGGWRKRLVDATLAVPGSVSRITDTAAFRREVLIHLLQAPELRLISVWHPSFLSLLLGCMAEQWEELLVQIRGERRRALLRACGPGDFRTIWPKLKLISCWADGPAAVAATRLREVFPHVRIQPKGLLATEAFVTIPFAGARPVAIRSHFFEFLDDTGRSRLAGDLAEGAESSVVVTTSGGLYRYRLGDRVRVTGRVGRTPSLEFLGREQGVTDRFGEKLNERFVAEALSALFLSHAVKADFAMVVPETGANGGHYTLFIECGEGGLDPLARDLETRFRINPHYALCVSLGQLQPLRVERVRHGAFERYLAWRASKGMRSGNVKPAVLCGEPGVAEVLRGGPRNA